MLNDNVFVAISHKEWVSGQIYHKMLERRHSCLGELRACRCCALTGVVGPFSAGSCMLSGLLIASDSWVLEAAGQLNADYICLTLLLAIFWLFTQPMVSPLNNERSGLHDRGDPSEENDAIFILGLFSLVYMNVAVLRASLNVSV